MDMIETKLLLLSDILKRKTSDLEQILSICENQEYISKERNLASDEKKKLMIVMDEEKQSLINSVLKYDKTFQSTFDSIKDIYKEHIVGNEDVLRTIQALIKEAVDLDLKIRTQENVTLRVLKDVNDNSDKTTKQKYISKSSLLTKYKQNNSLKRK